MRLARRMEWKQLQAGVPPSSRKVGVKLKEDKASSHTEIGLRSATSKQAVQNCRPHHHPALRCNPPLQNRRCKVAGLITIQRFAAIRHFKAGGAKLQASSPSSASLQSRIKACKRAVSLYLIIIYLLKACTIITAPNYWVLGPLGSLLVPQDQQRAG